MAGPSVHVQSVPVETGTVEPARRVHTHRLAPVRSGFTLVHICKVSAIRFGLAVRFFAVARHTHLLLQEDVLAGTKGKRRQSNILKFCIEAAKRLMYFSTFSTNSAGRQVHAQMLFVRFGNIQNYFR